jgi:transposase
LANQLLELDREIKHLDKQIVTRFAEHPHAAPITSVDGFGPILGAQLLVDTGGDLIVVFGNSGRLVAYAGLAPVPRDSGRLRGNLSSLPALPPRPAQSVLPGRPVGYQTPRRAVPTVLLARTR